MLENKHPETHKIEGLAFIFFWDANMVEKFKQETHRSILFLKGHIKSNLIPADIQTCLIASNVEKTQKYKVYRQISILS